MRERIRTACGRAHRDPGDVRIVAVTKSVGVHVAAALVRLGLHDLGENRVAGLRDKRAGLAGAYAELFDGASPPPVRWHMIGHLQRRKVRDALGAMDVLHAGDRPALLQAIASRSAGGARLPVFLQVNVSGEASKGGVPPAAVGATLEEARGLEGLEVRGLMTMAPAAGGAEAARPVFRELRLLRDALRARGHARIEHLSMGMSGDFETAVEEGASIVRLGRLLLPSGEPDPTPFA